MFDHQCFNLIAISYLKQLILNITRNSLVIISKRAELLLALHRIARGAKNLSTLV